MSFAKKFAAERHIKDERCEKGPANPDDIVENYTVEKKKPYCETCDQGFKYQWSYEKHMRT